MILVGALSNITWLIKYNNTMDYRRIILGNKHL